MNLPQGSGGGDSKDYFETITELRCDIEDPPVDRQLNTIYQNSGDVPMLVTVQYVHQAMNIAPTTAKGSWVGCFISPNGGGQFWNGYKAVGIGGGDLTMGNQVGGGSWGNKTYGIATFIVPSGMYFQVTGDETEGGTIALQRWTETK